MQAASQDRLVSTLPRRMKHLQLFEDLHVQPHAVRDTKEPRFRRIELLPALATTTPELQHLTAGFLTGVIDHYGLRQFYLDDSGIPDPSDLSLPQLGACYCKPVSSAMAVQRRS